MNKKIAGLFAAAAIVVAGALARRSSDPLTLTPLEKQSLRDSPQDESFTPSFSMADLKARAKEQPAPPASGATPQSASADSDGGFSAGQEVEPTDPNFQGWRGTILKLYGNGTANVDWGLGTTIMKTGDLKAFQPKPKPRSVKRLGGFWVGEDIACVEANFEGWRGTIRKLYSDGAADVYWGDMFGTSSIPIVDLKAYKDPPQPKSVGRYGDFSVGQEVGSTENGFQGWRGTITKLYDDGTADVDWGLGTTLAVKLDGLKAASR